MAHFHPLTVTDIKRDTRDSVVVTLKPPPEANGDFKFIQGQYLTFRRVFDGEEMRRSYSICAGVNDGILRVGIKKVDGGWFSSWANEELKIGDTLEAMQPMGNFHAPLKPAEARSYLGFAGGSGITPLISLIKTVLDAEPKSTFTLVYGNRGASAIMFREELEDLKNLHMGRLNIVHVLENESADIDLFSGRLDREKCDALFSRWINVKGADLAFICGPEPMMLAVSESLKAHGMNESAIKFELFASAHPGRAKKKSAADGIAARGAKCSATIVIDGVARVVELAKGEQTVLEAAIAASIDAPFACKAGVCSTCRAKLIEGEVDMEANYALEDYEVERGYILTCQSHPRTDRIVVDYDQ
ncbi:MAG: phenylacetic acid degradation protein [Alphaproteobacteria bacterium RIFCSPHIGHO2_12_FULL_63_12]|nr:MAG: phenylacetic acid degradation protein [Alphaproteobacteria bacterium RIFCSPHIGHO2_12_FULL_63_12]